MPDVCFKRCPTCGQTWQDRDSFLADPSLTVNGYMANFESLEEGLFLFTHDAPACGSTLSIFAADCLDLYDGVRFPARKALSPECPRYCIDPGQLARCDVMCECAFVREILQIVKTRRERDLKSASQ